MNWQEFVSLHHSIDIIDENTIRVPRIAYDFEESGVIKDNYDHVVTKMPKGYKIDEYLTETNILKDTYEVESIYNYLGY